MPKISPPSPPASSASAPAIVSPIPPAPRFAQLTIIDHEEFRAASTDGEWRAVTETSATSGAASDDGQAALRRHVTDLLLSENLIVLTGLGTSLCVVNPQGDRLAPTMSDLWAHGNTIVGGKTDDLCAAVRYVAPADQHNVPRSLAGGIGWHRL